MESDTTVRWYLLLGKSPLILKVPSLSILASSYLSHCSHLAITFPSCKGKPFIFETYPKALNATRLAVRILEA